VTVYVGALDGDDLVAKQRISDTYGVVWGSLARRGYGP
jgi:hypothetical protein